jgi:hypothetical protein
MDGAIELRPGRQGQLEIAIEAGLSGLFERPVEQAAPRVVAVGA